METEVKHWQVWFKERNMILTKEIIEQGKSSNSGWSAEQLNCFGETFVHGWKRRIIGKDFPEETIKKFVALKNQHLSLTKRENIALKDQPPLF
jgi:hypothetical protein